MPSEINWYIPNRVLYVREYGALTLDDTLATNEQAREHLDGSTRKLHILIDHTDLESAPRSLSGLVKTLDTFRHPNMGWFVIIGHGSNRYFRALAQFITHFFGTNMREVDSLGEALAFLVEIDEDLEPFIEQRLAHHHEG